MTDALSPIRDITLTLSNALPIDASKAVMEDIEKLEFMYARDNSSVADLVAEKRVLTGKTPYKVYIFDLTNVMATGTYTYAFLEEAPNVESATTSGINGNP